MGIQPARADHAGHRRASPAGVGVLDRRDERSSGARDRAWRRDVRGHTVEPGPRARREDRTDPLALSVPDARGRFHHSSDEPWHRAARGQGLPRRRQRRARRAQRPHRTGSLDDEGRGEQERVLHVARAARRRRQDHGRHVRFRSRHPRLHRGVRRRKRHGDVAGPHGPGAGRTWKRDVARGRGVEDGRGRNLDRRQL